MRLFAAFMLSVLLTVGCGGGGGGSSGPFKGSSPDRLSMELVDTVPELAPGDSVDLEIRLKNPRDGRYQVALSASCSEVLECYVPSSLWVEDTVGIILSIRSLKSTPSGSYGVTVRGETQSHATGQSTTTHLNVTLDVKSTGSTQAFQRKEYGVGRVGEGALALGDANGDGYLDVVAPCRDADALCVFWGSVEGGLNPGPEISVGGEPRLLELSDINNDQREDIVVGTRLPNLLQVLVSRSGVFERSLSLPLSSGASSVSLMDVDGNSSIDILTDRENREVAYARTLVLLLGHGDGGFSEPVTVLGEAESDYDIVHFEAADLDGDSIEDIVAWDEDVEVWDGTRRRIYRLIVMTGDGEGGFGAPHFVHSVREKYSPLPGDVIVIRDFNRDQILDLLTSGGGGGIFLGYGGLEFQEPRELAWSKQEKVQLVPGDINGDGLADVVYYGHAPRTQFGVALGKGNGEFEQPELFEEVATVSAIAVGDLNGDGNSDLVLLTDNRIVVMKARD